MVGDVTVFKCGVDVEKKFVEVASGLWRAGHCAPFVHSSSRPKTSKKSLNFYRFWLVELRKRAIFSWNLVVLPLVVSLLSILLFLWVGSRVWQTAVCGRCLVIGRGSLIVRKDTTCWVERDGNGRERVLPSDSTVQGDSRRLFIERKGREKSKIERGVGSKSEVGGL